jgi:hypothetical protein
MPEITQCPGCQRKLQVPEALMGQQVQCPTCGTMFTAATDADAPPPLPSQPQVSPTPLPPGPAPPREDEEPRRRRRPDDYHDRYDDYDEYEEDRYRRRRRRDLMPHRGSTILTLGILSLVICGLLGPIAWVMGNTDLADMRAGRMDPEGEATTNAGRICGMIASILLIVGFCIVGLWILIMASQPRGVFR